MRASAYGDRMVSCSLCGATADEPPLTWTRSVERGATHYYCDACSRENVRVMESRLDAEWF
ncbi:MAG: hypothetical protein QOH80_282 [Actinomycetota bacterium]|jgi:hypothetical protein|nr:hypothetical protein [Actinomycetota bacterium]